MGRYLSGKYIQRLFNHAKQSATAEGTGWQ